jgi:uncharacterized membrane protein
MNLSGREQIDGDTMNVVSLFGNVAPEMIIHDPLSDLLNEAVIEDKLPVEVQQGIRKVANENQFPDQSMYILEEQLANLKTSLKRIKFYLGDLDDLIPR